MQKKILMIKLLSFSQQLISLRSIITLPNLQEEQSELMDSIRQIHQKKDLVSGFIRFCLIQNMETHFRVTTLHNCNIILRTIQFKTICLANAFMEKKCVHNYLMEHSTALNVLKNCILI